MPGAQEAAGPQAAMPRHVAIVMDGNGRWAAKRGLPRSEGHRRGVEALRRVVRAAGDMGIAYLTVFSFSTENWRRPEGEVSFLLGLVRRFVEKDLAELHAAGVRVRMIGSREANIAPETLALVERAEALTRDNSRMTLTVAFNYGARDEILRATRRLARKVAAGELAAEAIDEARFSAELDTAELPDPDLVIRSSGELRLSNFLLWQAAYAEYVFPETLWPDFDERELRAAVAVFGDRERRYGGLTARTG